MSEILGDKLNIVYEDTLLEITPGLMKKTILKQDKEIKRLNNIINNAIKGIEDYYYGDKEYKEYDYTLAYQIYHILKGSDKE